MTHWKNRAEPKWSEFQFNQPYAKGLHEARGEWQRTTELLEMKALERAARRAKGA